MYPGRRRRTLTTILLGCAVLVGHVQGASASGATDVVSAGAAGLTFASTPSSITFPPVTSGVSGQTVAQTQLYDVSDVRGTGAGWNVSIAATDLTAGTHTMPISAVTVQSAPVWACDAVNSCSGNGASGISFPLTMTNSATKLLSAPVNTGLGTQQASPTFQLTIPGGSVGGSYVSTWTITLGSSP